MELKGRPNAIKLLERVLHDFPGLQEVISLPTIGVEVDQGLGLRDGVEVKLDFIHIAETHKSYVTHRWMVSYNADTGELVDTPRSCAEYLEEWGHVARRSAVYVRS